MLNPNTDYSKDSPLDRATRSLLQHLVAQLENPCTSCVVKKSRSLITLSNGHGMVVSVYPWTNESSQQLVIRTKQRTAADGYDSSMTMVYDPSTQGWSDGFTVQEIDELSHKPTLHTKYINNLPVSGEGPHDTIAFVKDLDQKIFAPSP